jgi:hypothetical protein
MRLVSSDDLGLRPVVARIEGKDVPRGGDIVLEHRAHKAKRGIRAIATGPALNPEISGYDPLFILTASSCTSMIAHRSVEGLE